MTYSPESYNLRVQEFLSLDEVDISQFPIRTAEEVAQRRIGDAERAACTLLSKASITHPVLGAWIQDLTNDTAFHAWLDSFAGVTQAWLSEGFGVENARLTYPTDPEEAPSQWAQALDKAAYKLAVALVTHRLQGEDGLDTTSSVSGIGITTSLAAALVECHLDVCNVYAAQLQRARLGVK